MQDQHPEMTRTAVLRHYRRARGRGLAPLAAAEYLRALWAENVAYHVVIDMPRSARNWSHRYAQAVSMVNTIETRMISRPFWQTGKVTYWPTAHKDARSLCIDAANDAGWVSENGAAYSECQWFAGCGHVASRWVDHPVLERLAVCACTAGGHPPAERTVGTWNLTGSDTA